ncbi:adapter protein CIKS isoform X2 [Archocentrus centrarchus]|uniref:adapter protein CIKS isoform X2 n=1 Tax=Archocentrus centrarchus TaxID=63155 RepID=UPI0011E9DD26|nr:adapter protein CIKS isoform X2 [Archocentrus centrarchus]
MDSYKGPCPHQSIPVEMDESLDCFPPCEQCSGHMGTGHKPEARGCEPPQGAAHNLGLFRHPESQYQHQLHTRPPAPAPSGHMKPPNLVDAWHVGLRQKVPQYRQDAMGPSSRPWGHSMEESDYLEPPQPLKSDFNYTHHTKHPDPSPLQGSCLRPCGCFPPANLPHHNNNNYYDRGYPAGPHQEPQPHQQLNPFQNTQPPKGAPNVHSHSVPQFAAPHPDMLHEVSVGRAGPAGTGSVTREIKKTISLPEECRKVFITYSVDTANEIITFVKFLVDQGFKPSIDMFDSAIRNMGINQWMDRFLNDKSVLIIVVISPKYKEDVEGDGDDEHGLHTKYIHNQIQNEYIQQGCLNFRLVPVLFPSATKRHVPSWLQSTRIYRWPQDTQDLLLRLLREERYIIPQRSADLTLTVRTL